MAEAHKKKLRPGELDVLILIYMHREYNHGQLTPTAISKGIDQPRKAVAKCLERLAKEEKIRAVPRTPLAYHALEIRPTH